MFVKDLKKIVKDLNDNSKVVIFVLDENKNYRPFENINHLVLNKGSMLEQLHFDVSVFDEYKSNHFPNNLSKEEIDFLLDKRNIIMEELNDVESVLDNYNIRYKEQ